MCFGFIGAAVTLWGQAGGGELTGRVSDQSGKPVLGALVIAENQSNHLKQQTVTTSSGDFLFHNLQSATYQVVVSADKFKRLDREGILVETGERVRADLTLQVGVVTETVRVKADAALLQTEGSNRP
jgi:hypothetical protein